MDSALLFGKPKPDPEIARIITFSIEKIGKYYAVLYREAGVFIAKAIYPSLDSLMDGVRHRISKFYEGVPLGQFATLEEAEKFLKENKRSGKKK